tara:strand:+ start:466 stop:900 length:435 start_codon:yes stop_codon:yes gene_type:complete
MPNTFLVEVVSAEDLIFSDHAEFVVLPGETGELGIFPKHTPLITRIKPGSVRVKRPNLDEEFIFVAGGILEVQPSGVTVLANTAIRGKDLDEKKALEIKKMAEDAIHNKNNEVDFAVAKAELSVALAELAAIKKLKQKRNSLKK